MSLRPVRRSVLRIDLPLCPGSMTTSGALAVGCAKGGEDPGATGVGVAGRFDELGTELGPGPALGAAEDEEDDDEEEEKTV